MIEGPTGYTEDLITRIAEKTQLSRPSVYKAFRNLEAKNKLKFTRPKNAKTPIKIYHGFTGSQLSIQIRQLKQTITSLKDITIDLEDVLDAIVKTEEEKPCQ